MRFSGTVRSWISMIKEEQETKLLEAMLVP